MKVSELGLPKPPSKWQPLETAPKNTLILVKCDTKTGVGYAIMDCAERDDWVVYSGNCYCYMSLEEVGAVGWMLLPD